ncbi:MAG: hypothetical protein ACFCUI_14135, partial [Bernardetiaceae bacterium]
TNLKKQHRTDFTKLAQYDLTTSKEITIPEKEPDPKTAPAEHQKRQEKRQATIDKNNSKITERANQLIALLAYQSYHRATAEQSFHTLELVQDLNIG